MDKYDFFSKDNILVLAEGDAKSKKKGTGIGEILALAREIVSFIDRVDACAEAQDISENKSKIEAISAELEKHYIELLDMAKSGRSTMQKDPMTGQDAAPAPGPSAPAPGPSAPALPTSPTPSS